MIPTSLMKKMIDQHSDAQEQNQPVQPHPPGEHDHAQMSAGRQMFGHRFAQAEQGFAQVPAGQGKRARMQVGLIQRVHGQEIAVKAHERRQVDGQRRDPGGCCQGESHGPGRTVRQQTPGQTGPGGDGQLGQDAGTAHQKPLAAGVQLPRFVDVGVKHRPQHQKGHPHGRHPAAEGFGGIGMAQFVADFGQSQGDAESSQSGDGKVIDKGGGEALPLPPDQQQSDQ